MIYIFLLHISQLQRKRYLVSSAYKLFILIVLFSSQLLSIAAFNLVNCVWVGSKEYLRVDAKVECYQTWQWMVYSYILFFNIPFCLILFLGSGMLRLGLNSERTFLLGLLFPGPFLIYISFILYKKRKCIASGFCHTRTTDAILSEVWYGYKPFFSYHYLSWGGIIHLRRLALVIFSTLISSPHIKILCLTGVIIIALVIHVKFHPYSDHTANACAIICLYATMFCGILNIGWATLLYSGIWFDYGIGREIAQGLATVEMCLIEMVPLGIISYCCLQILWDTTCRQCMSRF